MTDLAKWFHFSRNRFFYTEPIHIVLNGMRSDSLSTEDDCSEIIPVSTQTWDPHTKHSSLDLQLTNLKKIILILAEG